MSNGSSWGCERLLSASKNCLNNTTGNSHKVIVNNSETVETLHLHNNSSDAEVLYVYVALHLYKDRLMV